MFNNLICTLCFLYFLLPATLLAQVTLVITQVPDSHPTDAPIYVAGNFNGWNPADEQYQLIKGGNGFWSITFHADQEWLEFKFTRGAWDAEEVNDQGEVMDNRRWRPQANVRREFQIAGWKDLDTDLVVGGSTASPQVHIWQEEFPMENLGRSRRIWVYLPAGYETSEEQYPVLYMHDGQNLFDAQTSYAGEWSVDETLDRLQLPLIVVGIDNGGVKRMDEYTPYPNPERGEGGEGSAYIDFVVQELKPAIDSALRTKSDPYNTGVMGSSLGGLISMHAATRYPKTFCRLGLFSTSVWFSRDQLLDDVANYSPVLPVRAYLLVGKREGAMMVGDAKKLAELLSIKPNLTVAYHVVPRLGHTEALWADNFEAALRHLYPELF